MNLRSFPLFLRAPISRGQKLHKTCSKWSFSRLSGAFSDEKSRSSELAILRLPLQFLRDSDSANYDPITCQRADVLFDQENGRRILQDRVKPAEIESCELIDGTYKIIWKDGRESRYTEAWVQQQLQTWTTTEARDRVLWSGLTEEAVRSSSTMTLSFSDLLTDEGMSFAIRALYVYGIILISQTPTDTSGAAVAAMASCLGGGEVKNRTTMLNSYRNGSKAVMIPRGTDGPLRTLYGTVWSTTSSEQEDGASVADSAYGHGALPLHTDMTYLRDPPGLQIFTMLQPALRGGESIFGDGFAAADRLRSLDPESFGMLADTTRRYRCIDQETGWHLEASGPVLSLHHDQIVSIRHNDLDRLPDLPPTHTSLQEQHKYYAKLRRAHHLWDKVLSEDDIRLEMHLRKGDTVVVANQVRMEYCESCERACRFPDEPYSCIPQRCFHGRKSFTSSSGNPRVVMGCYVSQDELNSRFRMKGFRIY